MSGRELQADCGNCVGLCCVTLTLTRSADFAIDKPSGQPCPNLAVDSRCAIHAELRPRGFAGCTDYDCFGAGQHVTQTLFDGQDWRTDHATAAAMFATFGVVRALHELLYYLAEAQTLAAAAPLHSDLRRAVDVVEVMTGQDPAALTAVDVDGLRDEVNPLLQQASVLARAGVSAPAQLRGADLVGADLRTTALRGANLRGARLVGADLRQVDLSLADVTGADLRGARLAGADLRATLFLVQAQLDAAAGDDTTRLPTRRARPRHWADEAAARSG